MIEPTYRFGLTSREFQHYVGTGDSTGTLTSNTPATNTLLSGVQGIYCDYASGNLYIPSTGQNAVAAVYRYLAPTSAPSRRSTRHPSRQPTISPSVISYVTAPPSSITVPALNWSAIAMDAYHVDGQIKYSTALQRLGGIYTASSPLGLTWTLKERQAEIEWSSIAMSGSGQYQLASASSSVAGSYARSKDYGLTWNLTTLVSNSDQQHLPIRSVAMDDSGQYAFFSIYGNDAIGLAANNFTSQAVTSVYKTSDYGITWHNQTITSLTAMLFAAAINGNATVQVIATYCMQGSSAIYYSHSTGVTWSTASLSSDITSAVSASSASSYWIYATCSYHGQYVALLSTLRSASNGDGSTVVAYSKDYGQSYATLTSAITTGTSAITAFSLHLSASRGASISLSASGQYWLMVHANLYLSKNYGASWIEVDTPRSEDVGGVKAIALQSDGSLALLMPAQPEHRIYVYSVTEHVFSTPGKDFTSKYMKKEECNCAAEY